MPPMRETADCMARPRIESHGGRALQALAAGGVDTAWFNAISVCASSVLWLLHCSSGWHFQLHGMLAAFGHTQNSKLHAFLLLGADGEAGKGWRSREKRVGQEASFTRSFTSARLSPRMQANAGSLAASRPLRDNALAPIRSGSSHHRTLPRVVGPAGHQHHPATERRATTTMQALTGRARGAAAQARQGSGAAASGALPVIPVSRGAWTDAAAAPCPCSSRGCPPQGLGLHRKGRSATWVPAASDTAVQQPSTSAHSNKGLPQSGVWEIDFCSRPLLDERGKKVWELLICDPERNFEFSEFFPNSKINSGEVRRPAPHACRGHAQGMEVRMHACMTAGAGFGDAGC